MESPACASATRPTSGSCTTTRTLPPPCAPPSTCSPSLGAEVDEADPGFADPVQAFHVLWFAGEAKVLQAYGDTLDALADRVDPGLRRTAALGATYSASDYLDATAVRMELGRLMGRFHETYDVLVTPTLPLPAFPVGQGRAGRLALARLDELDAVHLSVQSDPAARAERSLRIHPRRAADRTAGCRRPAQPTRWCCASARRTSPPPSGTDVYRDFWPRRLHEQVDHRVVGQARRELCRPHARRPGAPNLCGGVGRVTAGGAGVPRQVCPQRDLHPLTGIRAHRSREGEHHDHTDPGRPVLVLVRLRRSRQSGVRLRKHHRHRHDRGHRRPGPVLWAQQSADQRRPRLGSGQCLRRRRGRARRDGRGLSGPVDGRCPQRDPELPAATD